MRPPLSKFPGLSGCKSLNSHVRGPTRVTLWLLENRCQIVAVLVLALDGL